MNVCFECRKSAYRKAQPIPFQIDNQANNYVIFDETCVTWKISLHECILKNKKNIRWYLWLDVQDKKLNEMI